MLTNTDLALDTLKELDADFLLLQEVDQQAHRSHQVDQRAQITEAFSAYSSTWAENFHSGYLAYR